MSRFCIYNLVARSYKINFSAMPPTMATICLIVIFSPKVHAQLSFHGHRDSVKFFVAVNGAVGNISSAKAYTMAGARPPSPTREQPKKEADSDASNKPTLVMSGGEGK